MVRPVGAILGNSPNDCLKFVKQTSPRLNFFGSMNMITE